MKLFFRSFLLIAPWSLFTAFYVDNDNPYIGLWKGRDSREMGYINLGPTGFAYFIIDNDTLGGEHFTTPEGNKGYMKYEVNEKNNPATIDFIMYESATQTEVGRVYGIFKMESQDRMNLCVNFEEAKVPDSFVGENCIILEKDR